MHYAAMDAIDVFNAKLGEFVDDMRAVYPDAKELKAYLQLSTQLNKRLAHSVFERMVVVPYGASILSRDESFLMSQDFQELSSQGGDLDIVSRLKTVWRSLSDADKDAIWKHMQLLVRLSGRIPATRD